MKTLPFDPFGQKEKILAEARAARHEQASAWKGQLEGDKGSREGLRQLAKAAPGIFDPEFMGELKMAEPEAQVRAEASKARFADEQRKEAEIKKQDALANKLTEVGIHAQEKTFRERDAQRDKDSKAGTELGIAMNEY